VAYAKEAEEKIEAIKWSMFQLMKDGGITPKAFDQLYKALQELA
jgi:hypothetical protein